MKEDKDLQEEGERLRELSGDVEELFQKQRQRADRLDAITRDAEELAADFGVTLDVAERSTEEKPVRVTVPYDLASAVGSLDKETRSRLDSEFLSSAPAVPPMDNLDRFVVITVGCMAAVSDFILVGLPTQTRWTPSKSLEGSKVPVGMVSELVKKWTVDNDNWLAKICKVPYDKSSFPGTDLGLAGWNHRDLTFAHHPSPLGLVMGMIDIALWSLTGTDIDAKLFHVSRGNKPDDYPVRLCLAPLLWLGHLVSDVATKQGIPIPETSFFGLCRLPFPGAPDDAAFADVVRQLYQQGYDFRQYLVGGLMVAGLVEGFIRLYDWARYIKTDSVQRDGVRAQLAKNYVADARKNARLASRLFWTHAIASGANAGRITIQAVGTQDFFSAARNINLAEWELFTIRSIEYAKVITRDTDLDQALANRQKLEQSWDSLMSKGESARALYLESPTDLQFEKVDM